MPRFDKLFTNRCRNLWWTKCSKCM